jgi:hypothetical protein
MLAPHNLHNQRGLKKESTEDAGARSSEDEEDDAPTNTQAIGEDDDLDQTRGVNNEVGRGHVLPILEITPKPPRKRTKRLRTWSALRYSPKTVEHL